MDMLNVKINGISVSVEKGSTILDAARAAGVEIPTLCFMKEKNEIGACRICVVEANEGRGFRIVTACVYPVSEGMEVLTNTEKIQKARRTTLELILSTHEKKCLSCVRSTNCELQKLCRDYGMMEISGEDVNSSRQSMICKQLEDPQFKHLVDATWKLIEREKVD